MFFPHYYHSEAFGKSPCLPSRTHSGMLTFSLPPSLFTHHLYADHTPERSARSHTHTHVRRPKQICIRNNGFVWTGSALLYQGNVDFLTFSAKHSLARSYRSHKHEGSDYYNRSRNKGEAAFLTDFYTKPFPERLNSPLFRHIRNELRIH